jgi:hypothetical protein
MPRAVAARPLRECKAGVSTFAFIGPSREPIELALRSPDATSGGSEETGICPRGAG